MSQKNKISIKVAGAAGQGVESGGQGLAKSLRRGGLHIFGVSDYMSLIKGGHNFFQITVSDEPVYCNTEKIHILVSFDPQQVEDTIPHIRELHEGGIFILDEAAKIDPLMQAAIEEVGAICCPMPLVKLATEIGGSRIMMNTVALGAVAGIMKLPFEALDSVVRENFTKKSPELADKNSQVARSGYDFAIENLASRFRYSVKYNPAMGQKMLINGNDAIAFGAWSAGCRFISAYPMTPGTSVFEWFTKRNSKIGAVTKHTEDEIAAICMAIGAAQVGVRSMTTTSGGGFCLMVEALGLAGMTEVGVVVVNAMRGGPSTGLPTRTEQADLLFAINASHGEFPKIVLTPGTIEQCFEAGARAHNLAEKYQTPVIILTDQLLAAEIYDIDPDRFKIPEIDRGKLLTKEQVDKLESAYLRYQFTEDGISPRALQGHPKVVHAPATDEHNETGHITENPANRNRMMEKRMQKLETARREMKAPELIGPENADLTMIVWGSTHAVAFETIELFNRDPANKAKINALHFSEAWPLPHDKVREALKKVKFSVSVEQNYTSQFAHLLRSEIGYEMNKQINRYDGRPFMAEQLVDQLKEILSMSLITA